MVPHACMDMGMIKYVHSNHIGNLVTMGDHWLTRSKSETVCWIAFCKKELQMGPECNILYTSILNLSVPKITLQNFSGHGEGLCVTQERCKTDPYWPRFTIWWFLGWILRANLCGMFLWDFRWQQMAQKWPSVLVSRHGQVCNGLSLDAEILVWWWCDWNSENLGGCFYN